jgi:hypothetical protein
MDLIGPRESGERDDGRLRDDERLRDDGDDD